MRDGRIRNDGSDGDSIASIRSLEVGVGNDVGFIHGCISNQPHGVNAMTLKELSELESFEWPEDAKDTILATLRNSDAPEDDRLLAAEMAGDYVVVDEETVEALLAVFEDGSHADELRGHAAIALGPVLEEADAEDFADEDGAPIAEETFHRIMTALHAMYQDTAAPTLVRRRALEAAVRASGDWLAPAIREAYASTNPDWTLTAVFCMQYVPGFEKEILEALGSDDEMVRFHAVAAAGGWELDQAWDMVHALALQTGADPELRMAATQAAASIRPDAAGALFLTLLDDPDAEVAGFVHDLMAMAAAYDEYEDDDGDDDVFEDEDEDTSR